MPKSPAELIREASTALAALTERVDHLREAQRREAEEAATFRDRTTAELASLR